MPLPLVPVAAAATAKLAAKFAASVVVVRRRRGRSPDLAASHDPERLGVWREDPEDEVESVL